MQIDANKLNISKKQLIAIAAIIVTGVMLGTTILNDKKSKTAEDDDHGSRIESTAHRGGERQEDPNKGSHGGKLFKEGDFGLEAVLAGDSGESRLRIWLLNKDKPLPNKAIKVSATITRLTGEKQTLNFIPDKDSLVSREVVAEPHAFEISIIKLSCNFLSQCFKCRNNIEILTFIMSWCDCSAIYHD